MNVEHEFVLIPNSIKQGERMRSYEVTFQVPGFRTQEHLRSEEVNIARLQFTYIPKECVVEFFSFHEYLKSTRSAQCRLSPRHGRSLMTSLNAFRQFAVDFRCKMR